MLFLLKSGQSRHLKFSIVIVTHDLGDCMVVFVAITDLDNGKIQSFQRFPIFDVVKVKMLVLEI